MVAVAIAIHHISSWTLKCRQSILCQGGWICKQQNECCVFLEGSYVTAGGGAVGVYQGERLLLHHAYVPVKEVILLFLFYVCILIFSLHADRGSYH